MATSTYQTNNTYHAVKVVKLEKSGSVVNSREFETANQAKSFIYRNRKNHRFNVMVQQKENHEWQQCFVLDVGAKVEFYIGTHINNTEII